MVNASQKFFEIIVSAYFEFRFYIEHKENNPISVSGGTLLSFSFFFFFFWCLAFINTYLFAVKCLDPVVKFDHIV